MKEGKIKFLIKSIISIVIIYLVYSCLWKYSAPRHSRFQTIADITAMLIQMSIWIYAMYKDTFEKNKSRYEAIIIGAIIGLSLAMILIGVKTLKPTNIGWIMNETDRRQHFLSWNFFVKDSWNFPLGFYKNWGCPNGMSVIFTDSIPIAAVFFKMFKLILPPIFQYLGMWLYLSFILMGAFIGIIFNKITDKLTIKVLATLFFIPTPMMFLRIGGHTSLTSHWLVLWAIYLLINEKYEIKHLISWTILVGLTVIIHPYFLFMVYIIFIIYIFKGILIDKKLNIKKSISFIGITVALVFFLMYVNGYFKVNAQVLDVGFGWFSFNLNGFFNPIGTSQFMNSFLAFSGQYEGFAYLGFGGILLVFLAVIDLLRNGFDKANAKLYITLIVTCIIFTMISLSNNITWAGHLISIPIGKTLTKIWTMVRATGRMIWPVWYIMTIYSFFKIIKSSKKNVTIIVLIILGLQIWDLSGMYIKTRNEFIYQKKWKNPLKDEFWNKVKKEYKHICVTEKLGDYGPIAYFASMNNFDMDYGYFARNPKTLENKLKENKEAILNGTFKTDSLYIVAYNKEFIDQVLRSKYKALIKEIDGYVVFSPRGF